MTLAPVAGTSGSNTAVQFGRGEDRFGNILADLARIDIDAQHEIDVTRAVAADVSWISPLRRIVLAVIGDALDERACAVAHADHGDLNWLHRF